MCSSGPATGLSSDDDNDFMNMLQSTWSNTTEENTKKEVDLSSDKTLYKTLHGWGPKITRATGCTTLDANHKNHNTARTFNKGINSYPGGDGCKQGTIPNNIQTVDITSTGRLAPEKNDSTIGVILDSDDILNVQPMQPRACRDECSKNDKCQAYVSTNGTCIMHNDNIRNTAGDINGVPTEHVKMHVKDASISTNKSCHGPYIQRWPHNECHATVAKGQEKFKTANGIIALAGLYARDIHSSIIPPRDRSPQQIQTFNKHK
jgi:hypothetical protein